VLDAYPGHVVVVKEDKTVVYLSRSLREVVGDVIGRKCYETRLASEEICRNCPIVEGGDGLFFPYTRTATAQNGAVTELTVTRHEDESTGEVLYISFQRDITESNKRHRYLMGLAASLDQMSDAVAIADSEGKVFYVNEAFAQLTGYTNISLQGEDGKGLRISDMRSSTPGRDMKRVFRESLSHGWTGEVKGKRQDGSTYIAHVEARPICDFEGIPIGVVGIFRDTTKESSERAELEKYRSQLEKKMEIRTAELAQRVSQLTTINKISRVITSILDPEELVQEFVKSIATGFGYQHVVVMGMDKDRGELHYRAGYGSRLDPSHRSIMLKLKEGIIGHAAFFSETLVSGDVDADPRYVGNAPHTTKSELAIPILFRGDLIGVLDIQSDVKDAFTRNDVTLLEMLTDMLAAAIVNARMFWELRERENALTVLDRISKQISYRQESSVILDQTARDAANLLKGEKAIVGLKDEANGTVVWVATYNFGRETVDDTKVPADRGVTGRALSRLKAEVVNDYLSDPDAVPEDAERLDIRSMVCAPLVIEGRGIGVINVYNKQMGEMFTKSDATFLSSLADHAAIALENSNLLSSLNQRVRSQLALLETALSMQRQIDTGEIYEYMADKLREVIWYDDLTFYRVDQERDIIVPVLSRGSHVDEVMSEVFPLGEGITGHVAKTGVAELVNDTSKDDRAVLVQGTEEDYEAIMSIPLKGKEGVIGVLCVYRSGPKTFSSADFEIAQLFASQAAVALENSELYSAEEDLLKESRNKVIQMTKVLELTTSVMYMDDLDGLLKRLTEAVVSSFGFKRASVSLLESDRNMFVNRALAGYPEWVVVGEEMEADRILEDMKEQFRIGDMTYYINYEDQEYGIEAFDFIAHPENADKPRTSADAWHERDILMVALRDRGGRLIGYLLVDEPEDMKAPDSEQLRMLEILGGIASIAVENSRLFGRQVSAFNEIALLNDLMTHDINNFNQGIMGYIELMLQDRRLDESQRRYAEKALVQVRNNARIIDNIRKLARVRAMSETEVVPWDIHEPITRAQEYITKQFSDRAVKVVSLVPKDVHYVLANQHVHDLFQNVLSNAVKFDSARNVRVDISVSESEDAQGNFWIVSITDRGRGIPDERKRAVFERFATGMTGVKGFGLGLSIVSTIVEKYHGRVWVEDRVKGDFSKGAVFKIMLPKAGVPREGVSNSGKSKAGKATSTESS